MKKIIVIALVAIGYANAWEVTTHRAIDKAAIEGGYAKNLKKFIDASGISGTNYKNEDFEGYGLTYFEYFNEDVSSDAVAEWNQTFSKHNYQDLIEAGTMLEDAVWAGGLFAGDGRFNNHFYDPQNGGKPLSFGWGSRTDAVSWAKNNMQEEV